VRQGCDEPINGKENEKWTHVQIGHAAQRGYRGGATAKVHQGAVTLEGEVTWKFERDAAERAVRHLAGVVTATDRLKTLQAQPGQRRA
jgi:osmotically-inducible protein OsmY